MGAPESMEKLVGRWTGTSRLSRPWLSPQDSESPSTASVALVARGTFVAIDYTWAVDGEPQQGFLLLGRERGRNAVNAVWVDSWHMSERPMSCHGSVDDAGAVAVVGSYSAPPGPDWGWRTVIAPAGGDSFEVVMYNVSPDGEEALAFVNRYGRAP